MSWDVKRAKRFVERNEIDKAVNIYLFYEMHDDAALLRIKQGNFDGAIKILTLKLQLQLDDLIDQEKWQPLPGDVVAYNWLARQSEEERLATLVRTGTISTDMDNYRKLGTMYLTKDRVRVLRRMDGILSTETNGVGIVRELVALDREENLVSVFGTEIVGDLLVTILYFGALRDVHQSALPILYFANYSELYEADPEAYKTYAAIQNLQMVKELGLKPLFNSGGGPEEVEKLANKVRFENTFQPGANPGTASSLFSRNHQQAVLYVDLNQVPINRYEKAYVRIKAEDIRGLVPFLVHSAKITGAKTLKISVDPYEMEKHDYFVVYFPDEKSRKQFSHILDVTLGGRIQPTDPPPLSYPVGRFVAGGTDLPGANHRARVARALAEAFVDCRARGNVRAYDIRKVFSRHHLSAQTFRTPEDKKPKQSP
ncbi:MAG: hypothetical protein HY537_16100 [Deltaproteobacteria bacterium]|nr:hypothetical protein [Deltaproteobacteria bacterium]